MSDINDLHGVFPTPLRWNAEAGVLGYGTYDAATGERSIEEIELGSPEAKFVMDYACRARGYGLIRVGLYDMRLSPIGSPTPEWPGDPDFKPAIGCWMWNPPLGELRLETAGAMFRKAIVAVWDRCRTFKEASEGLQPVVFFIDRRNRLVKAVGKTFWEPIIDIIGWVPRDKVPPFALRAPTVKPPVALDSQVSHALLGHLKQKALAPSRGKAKPGAALKRGSLNEFLDDRLPDDPIPEL
jgi:hypothetical protein